MFPQFDQAFLEQLTANPAEMLNKLADFQRANFDAARQIAQNNLNAFQELANPKNAQNLANAQPILQAAIEKNVEVLTGVWSQFGVQMSQVAMPSKPGRK